MKRLLLLVILFAVLCIAPASLAEENISAADIEVQVRQELLKLDLSEWQETIDQLAPEMQAFLSNTNAAAFFADTALNGLKSENAHIFSSIWNILKQELKSHAAFLCGIVGISLLGGIIAAFEAEGKRQLQEILGFIFYCFAVSAALSLFSSCISIGNATVKKLASFIQAAFPLLMTLLSTVGASAGSGMMQPAMSMLTGTVSIAIQNVIIPLILAGGVFSVLNNFTGRVHLDQLAKLSRSCTKWILGLMFTLYTGVVTLQGLSIQPTDGISIRAAKFALDRFIPVVGGMVSGTVDTVLGCTLLIKNAAGIATILLTALIVAIPLLKIGCSIFIYRIAAALCEPIADPRIPKLLSAVSDTLCLLFAALIVLSIMFIITAGLTLGMNGIALGN